VRAGALVLSLDFELAWGAARWQSDSYRRNLEGARLAIPRLLDLFAERDVAATWATVGFLFARSREEREAYTPPPGLRPAYREAELDSYVQPVGEGEEDDPLHYAPSVIAGIRNTARQEIATHTLSHYYCCAPGQTAPAFRADLQAACAIARARGIEITSIVFPRNQHNPAYDPILAEEGIRAYRGLPRAWMWRRAEARDVTSPGRRGARLFDSYANLSGHGTYRWSDVLQPSGLSDVRASRFLRPASSRATSRRLVLRRIRQSLRQAAERGEIYHLWWHPHNFGRHLEANLADLRVILDELERLREEKGMTSLSMRDVDRIVRGAEVAPRVSAASRPPIFS
jgi:peptidoglycan/xylan/chitin deacetylase (PgdA/CDA1 family)